MSSGNICAMVFQWTTFRWVQPVQTPKIGPHPWWIQAPKNDPVSPQDTIDGLWKMPRNHSVVSPKSKDFFSAGVPEVDHGDIHREIPRMWRCSPGNS